MKKITDLSIGDLIWVRSSVVGNSDKFLGQDFIKMVVVDFCSPKDDHEYLIARGFDNNTIINLELSLFNTQWFINNPEFWNSLS